MSEQWGGRQPDPAPAEELPAPAVEPELQRAPAVEPELQRAPAVEPEREPQPAAEPELEPELQPVAKSEPEDDSDPAVSAVHALRQRLAELEELPIEEHPARYEQLHTELTAALGRIDGGA